MNKICPKCHGSFVKKDGRRYGHQSYKCKDCRHVFHNSRRSNRDNNNLLRSYSVGKQTLKELTETTGYSLSTIHRRIKKALTGIDSFSIRVRPDISSYISSVLILDATFFGKKGSDTQWGILVAQDGISGDILASKHIFQETTEDYRKLLRTMKQEGYPKPHFAVIDGRNGVESVIHDFYDIPVQICQSHKIATVDRYLLKYPRRESYRELKRIAHDMTHTDKTTFIWMLETFREQHKDDFEAKVFDPKKLEYKRAHPRLHLAYKSLLRDINRLLVSLCFIQTIGRNINTSNRIECTFSHLKPKVKLHRGLSKERRLSLALNLLWKD